MISETKFWVETPYGVKIFRIFHFQKHLPNILKTLAKKNFKKKIFFSIEKLSIKERLQDDHKGCGKERSGCLRFPQFYMLWDSCLERQMSADNHVATIKHFLQLPITVQYGRPLHHQRPITFHFLRTHFQYVVLTHLLVFSFLI